MLSQSLKKGCLFTELATHMTPYREGLLQVEIEKCSVKNYQNSRFLKIHQVKQKIRKKFVFCTLTKPFGAYCQWSALHWPKYKWILSTWKISDLKNQQIKAKILTRKRTPSSKDLYSNNNKRCLKFEFKNLRKCLLPLLFFL